MRNKNIKVLTKLSLFVLLLSPVTTVISAATDTNYKNAIVMAPTADDTTKSDDNSQITTDDSGTTVSDTPSLDDQLDMDKAISDAKNKKSKKTDSIVKKDVLTKDNLSPFVYDPAYPKDDDHSQDSKGFTWNKEDPNTYEVSQVVYSDKAQTKPKYLNQVIIHKSGTPHMMKDGDQLDVTAVATMLVAVDGGTNDISTRQSTTFISAVPKTGYVNASDGSAVDPSKIKQRLTTENLNGSELNSQDPSENKDKELKSGNIDTTYQYGLQTGGVTLPDEFPFIDTTIPTLPAQNYSYAMANVDDADDSFGGNMKKAGNHMYSTYHIKYKEDNATEGTKTDIGAFGVNAQGSALTLDVFSPLVYSGISVASIDMTSKNEDGSDTEDAAVEFKDDTDLQAKTVNFSGTWSGGSSNASIYYRVNPSADESATDLTGATKLAAADVDQTKKTFTAKVAANDTYKFKEGKNTIAFYAQTEKGALGEVDTGTAYFKQKAENQAPIVSDVALTDNTKQVSNEEKDIPVSGKYIDPDGDLVSLQYQIDDGKLVDIPGFQNVSNEQSIEEKKQTAAVKAQAKKDAAKPSVVKKEVLPWNKFSEGMQNADPSYGDNDEVEISDSINGNELNYKISYTKTGDPDQTAVGDKITVTTRLTGIKPAKSKDDDGNNLFLTDLNSAPIFPSETTSAFNELDSGSAALYSADGEEKISVPLWEQGDGSFDDGSINESHTLGGLWQLLMGRMSKLGYNIKGSQSWSGSYYDKLASKTQYSIENGSTNAWTKYNYSSMQYDGTINGKDTFSSAVNPNGYKVTAPYIAEQNNMQTGDYFEYTYNYEVTDKAVGMNPQDLKFYAAIFDGSGNSTEGEGFFGNSIGVALPGSTIGAASITPDEARYSDTVSSSDLATYSKSMTGTYTDSTGKAPKIKYEVNPSGDTPSANAKDATVKDDGTYSADVTGNYHEGKNIVRFFLTSTDGRSTAHADVTVNLDIKAEAKNFDFDIPAADIKALGDKEVGTHKVHIFATDSEGKVSEDDLTVGTGSTGDFEVTNSAPTVTSLLDDDGKDSTSGKYVEGQSVELPLNLKWKDNSASVTGKYNITDASGTNIATGDIGTLINSKPDEENANKFKIAGSDMAKLKVGTKYTVQVVLTDKEGLDSGTDSPTYTIEVASANTAPSLDSLADVKGKYESIDIITEGSTDDLPLIASWTDNESATVSAKYSIVDPDGNSVATGNVPDIGTNRAPGESQGAMVNISGSDIAKLSAGIKYKVEVLITDDGGLDSAATTKDHTYLLQLKKKAGMEVPDTLSFKDVTVGTARQLDARDAGWDKVVNNSGVDVTVQQTKPWTTADGSELSLSPIEMITSADQFNAHRGTPIDDKAVTVQFDASGKLSWLSDANSGLLQPIGTGDLAGDYSTELTWTSVDAPK